MRLGLVVLQSTLSKLLILSKIPTEKVWKVCVIPLRQLSGGYSDIDEKLKTCELRNLKMKIDEVGSHDSISKNVVRMLIRVSHVVRFLYCFCLFTYNPTFYSLYTLPIYSTYTLPIYSPYLLLLSTPYIHSFLISYLRLLLLLLRYRLHNQI